MRLELQGAVRDLEISGEEQKTINQEALSVNEEHQSTNEELTALNSQLQETLERQRSTSDDLQNILYSTDVATLFLDMNLNIRFFTPATKSLFNVIPGDVGRPLTDLNSLSADTALPADARAVLLSLAPIEREIETGAGVWFMRRILPYRTHSGDGEGVVITFTDISERNRIRKALEESQLQAEQANAGKSRFLAMASHDLRQPLQTLALLQGLLARTVDGEKARNLVARFDETLGAMTGMLNTLLDSNQIEVGAVQPDFAWFRIDDVLARLRDEYTYLAQSQGLSLHAAPCSITVRSDPRLLEQMIRNLLSNAMKYTPHGKILLGCRRRAGAVSVEIWDTGVGIAGDQMQAIFEEYHQIGNAERARSRGLGLGLSIVQRLGKLLGHQVSVRSKPGKGSVFAIEVALPPDKPARQPERRPNGKDIDAVEPAHRTGTVLVVEDDPEVRSLLELLLQDEGHHVAIAPDGPAALGLADAGAFTPDILLTDFNLPAALNGLQLAARLREAFHTALPVIILTGDITTGTLGDIASQNCVRLTKPVKATELAQAVQRLLPAVPAKAPAFVAVPKTLEKSLIFIVDDDGNLRDAMRAVLEAEGWRVKSFATCEAFLGAYRPGDDACLLVDAYLPGMSGLELLKALRSAGHRLPAIMITGNSDAAIAVEAMKAGASDFIEKPVSGNELVENIGRVLEQARDTNKLDGWRGLAAKNIAGLTARERQILARAGAAGAGGLQCCGWIVPPLRPWVVSESIGATRIMARYCDTQHGSENEQHVDALALAANSPPRPAVNSLEQA